MIAATMFSGIGAPEVAMPDWRWAWHAETEKFPAAVFSHRHPGSINLGDVSANGFASRAKEIAKPRVLVFGSPCQSFSIAGKRLGLDDPRGNLALVALALVSELRPEWFVFENVPGLLSSDSGRDFGSFLGVVGKLGYGWTYRILDAQFFGVPQRRRRVFVVGNLRDWRRCAAILFEPKSLRRDFATSRQAGERTTEPTCTSSTGIGSFNNTGQGWWNDSKISAGLRDMSAGGGSRESTLIAHTLNAKGGAGRIDGESETFVCGTLSSSMGRRNGNEGVDGATTGKLIPVTSAVRRLTPRECERLQGFPDDYTLIPLPLKGRQKRVRWSADGQRYKAIGNSMAVPVLRWILSRIELFDQLKVAA